jgi:hypothetical protein
VPIIIHNFAVTFELYIYQLLLRVLFHFFDVHQGCQIFRGTIYQNGENIPNDLKIPQMAIKYTSIYYCKTLQNLSKLGFLVWKETVWQPWRALYRQQKDLGLIYFSPVQISAFVYRNSVPKPLVLNYVDILCCPHSWIFITKRNCSINDDLNQGCQIFLGTTHQNGENLPNYTNQQQNIPKSHEIYQHLLLQYAPKFTQIGNFGLKIYNLATLTWTPWRQRR